jgi:hypothetical protein
MPSGSFSVTLKRPKYGDWREAKKLYPVPNPQAPQNERPPYSPEELLLYTCLVGENDRPYDFEPKDITDRVANWDIEDKQFLTLAFINGIFMNDEEAKVAKLLGSSFRLKKLVNQYTITKDKLPSGLGDITFNKPNSNSQFAAERRFQGQHINGCTLEEMVFAASLESINGTSVERPKDLIARLDDMEIADVQFCSVVLVNTVLLDDSGTESAKELGKQKFRSYGSPKPASKQKNTSQTQTTQPRTTADLAL